MRVLQVNIERCIECPHHNPIPYKDIVGSCEHESQKDSLGWGRNIYPETEFVGGFPVWCELEELEEVTA